MHNASMPIGIRTTLTDSQVFQVTSHIVGLVVLCAEIPIHLLPMHQTYSLLICMRIPCRGSHCLNKFKVRKWTCEVFCSHQQRVKSSRSDKPWKRADEWKNMYQALRKIEQQAAGLETQFGHEACRSACHQ